MKQKICFFALLCVLVLAGCGENPPKPEEKIENVWQFLQWLIGTAAGLFFLFLMMGGSISWGSDKDDDDDDGPPPEDPPPPPPKPKRKKKLPVPPERKNITEHPPWLN